MAQYFNISGELTQQLLAPGDNVNISKISLTNIQKVSNCKVDLYIEKARKGKFYLIKGVELPVGATFIYDDTKFSNAAGEFGLFIKLTDGDTFPITITANGGTEGIDPAASTTVTGVGTSFLSDLSIGDEIVVSGETRTVSAIVSDTSLTVTSAFSNNSNDATPDCNPTALVDVIIN